jgi:hypothetical protein
VLLLLPLQQSYNTINNNNNNKQLLLAMDPLARHDLKILMCCVFKNGRAEIIANDQGNRVTPSYVAVLENGERLVGDVAKNQATINPSNIVFDVKRLIGRLLRILVPYKIVFMIRTSQ